MRQRWWQAARFRWQIKMLLQEAHSSGACVFDRTIRLRQGISSVHPGNRTGNARKRPRVRVRLDKVWPKQFEQLPVFFGVIPERAVESKSYLPFRKGECKANLVFTP